MSIPKQLNITPVILAGGAGKRLWPLTGPTRPKPFVRFFSKNSFLQNTLARTIGFASPIIICAAPFANQVFEQCYELGIKPRAILCEPAQRGTAPAIAAAAFLLKDSSDLMMVMPCDHMIGDEAVFAEAVRSASLMPQDIVLLGVKPKAAETRYGYITAGVQGALEKFTEKLSAQEALQLYVRPNSFWNTGIFISKPSAFLNRLQAHDPLVYKRISDAMENAKSQPGFVFPDIDHYINVPARSVEHVLMEKLQPGEGGMMPLLTEWQDLGTWGALLQRAFYKMLSRIEGSSKT